MAQIQIQDLPGADELGDDLLEEVSGGVTVDLTKVSPLIKPKPLPLPGSGIGGIAMVRG